MKRILAISVIFALLFQLTGCFGKGENITSINIYFKNKQTGELVAEEFEYEGKQSTMDMATFAMNMLVKGPSKDTNLKVLAHDAKFNSVSIKNEVAVVDFSEEFKYQTGVDELLSRFSVVRTLCGLPGITGVMITINSLPLTSNATGKEIGVMNKKDLVLGIDTQMETITIELYFATTDKTALKSEQRQVETYDTVSLEKTVINELLKGPKSTELESAIPQGTKLVSVETKEGVCYVNLSAEFINNFTGNNGTLAVYSIVNSICNLETVNAVQILVEGKTGEKFGQYTFDAPLEKNLSNVQKD